MGVYTSLLSSSGYLVVNKAVAANIGLTETIMLAELCSEYEYWAANDGLTEDGFFYSTVENVERNTTLGEKAQRKAVNKLVSLGIIEMKVIGIPPRRYFKINESAIGNMLEDGEKRRNQFLPNGGINTSQMAESIPAKGRTNNNNKNNNNKNNKPIYSDEKKAAKTKTTIARDATDADEMERAICEYSPNEDVQESLRGWIEMRIVNKKLLTVRALRQALKKLDKLAKNDAAKIEVIEEATVHSWMSFYETDAMKKTAAAKKAEDDYNSQSPCSKLKEFY